MRPGLERRQGQAIILVVVAVLVLTAILVLALDGGRIFLDRRQLQDAADAGALAGAERLEVLPYGNFAAAHTQALQTVVKNLPGTSTSGYTAPSSGSWGPLAIGASYSVTMTATVTTYQVTVGHTIATVMAPVHNFAPTLQLQAQATAQNATMPFAMVLLQSTYSSGYANLSLSGASTKLILQGGGGAADRGGVYSNASVAVADATIQFGSGSCPPDPPSLGNLGEVWAVTVTSLPSSQVLCPQSSPQAHTSTQILPDPGYPEPSAPVFTAGSGITVTTGTRYLCPGHYGARITIQTGATGVLLPGVFHVDAGGVSVSGTLRTLDSAIDTFPISLASTNCGQGVVAMPADPGAIIEVTPDNVSGQTTCSKNPFSVAAGATVALRASPKYYNISLYIEKMASWQTVCTSPPTGTNVVAIGNANVSIYGAIYGPADNIQIGGGGTGWGIGQAVAWTMTITGTITETFDPTKIPIIKGLTQ